ncbi:hypothetical protein [uncultured Sphingomonas sp.]|uniref:hypothetical protein n=1 Tax=uncultured Sphingomonas sp. TaxID=158754 RepID=UPI002624ED18|nr:hypothetical protein [uncultured Sphingomonas sp.]
MPRASRLSHILIIALIAVGVEIVVVRNAMGLSLSRIVPATLRLRFNGADAGINAAVASQLLVMESRANALAAQDYAQRALLRDPLMAEAARDSGVAAGLLGRTDALKRRLDYSLWVSRRDLPTLLGEIEQRVAAGDIAGALRYYDIALRSSGSAGTVLMPVLVKAVNDAPVRTALIGYINHHRPPWTQSYYDALLQTGRDWRALASVTRGLVAAKVPLAGDAVDQAIRTVAEAGHPAEAYGIYLAKTGSAEQQALRNGNFTSTEGTSPFDWNLTQEAGRQAVIADGQLRIDVARDTNGSVVSQLLILSPGRYRFRAKLDQDGDPGNALPYWRISCFPGSAEAGRMEARMVDAQRGWSGEFVVPPDCKAQELALIARAADAATTYSVSDAAISATR